jgi:serine/threonine-protein kinase
MPAFSPDGSWIAYVSDESGREEVYTRPFPGPGQKWQISSDGGSQVVWARNGELFYRNGNKMMAVNVKTRPNFNADTPQLLFEGQYSSFVHRRNYDVTSDGQRFLMLQSADPAATQVNVVLNWFEELKQRLPAK